ncbi:DUF1772 domain-containing protein [Streptomyces sp. NPDC058375]|uniref:anthrone oxygenase family protein n=1 Tax=Streptomyces sp. NPDC058375 TaxID=3346467 RepID=UPI00364C1CCD
MRHLQTATLLAATLSTGLMAGLFAAFAYAVMPGLARSSDRTLVDAMQGINKAILNPVFMLPFIGAIPFVGLAAVLAWQGHSRPALPWLIAALVLYLVAFAVTSGVNVPLNDQLDRAGEPDRIAQLSSVRTQFEARWTTWNVVRALLHTAAFACITWALIVHGAHQPQHRPGGDAADHAPAVTAYPAGSPHTAAPSRDVRRR